MFGGIVTAVGTGLKVILQALGLWQFFAERAERSAERRRGAEEAAAKKSAEEEARRKEEEAHKDEVHKRSDSDLDHSLDPWLRDN